MNFDALIRSGENVDLTEDDIRRILKLNIKILSYSQLNHADNIDTLLGPEKAVIILYEKSKNNGHWICLFLVDNLLVFFDPYGIGLDFEFKYENYNWRDEQNKGHLTHIIKRSNYKFYENKVKYQQMSGYMNTCGRHVVVRLKFRHLKPEQYQRIILNNKYSPDQLVTAFTILYSL